MKEGKEKPALSLSEFLDDRRKEIIAEWVEFARTLQPWAKDLTTKELRDHAEELLDAIVIDMRSSQSGHQQAEKFKGPRQGRRPQRRRKKRHAIDRLEAGSIWTNWCPNTAHSGPAFSDYGRTPGVTKSVK